MAVRKLARSPKSAFSLVELLMVLLVLAILMAVALPAYLQASLDAQVKTCRSNMQTIANAVQSSRVHNNLYDFSVLIAAGISTTNEPDLLTIPKCPKTGTYTLAVGGTNAASFQVNCSATSHGHYEAGIDTQ